MNVVFPCWTINWPIDSNNSGVKAWTIWMSRKHSCCAPALYQHYLVEQLTSCAPAQPGNPRPRHLPGDQIPEDESSTPLYQFSTDFFNLGWSANDTGDNQPKHESTPSTKWSYRVKIRDQARYQTMQELQMLPVSLFRDECWDCYSQLSEISVPKATNQLLIEGVLWMSLSLSSLSPFRIWHRCQTNLSVIKPFHREWGVRI